MKTFKKAGLIALFGLAPFLLTGCVGDIEIFACLFLPDSDHCYQASAVQEADPDKCEKIKGEKFSQHGSNPPRDKCYLQIAENTGDYNVCDRIKGGAMSYTQEECLLSVAETFENPSACKKMSGDGQQDCIGRISGVLTAEKVMELDDQIRTIKDELKDAADPELKKQLDELEKRRNDSLELLSKDKKSEYDRLSDPTNQMIIGDFALGELDSAAKEKLIALNEKLKSQGFGLTGEQYEAVKEYYKYKNDPSNDIEEMDDDQIAKDRWNEKLGNAFDKIKIWKSNPTEKEKSLDQQLRFYERMLERQEAINQGLSEIEQDVDRNLGILAGAGGDAAKDKIGDMVIESLFGKAAGTASGLTTKVLGEALDTVKAEAKSAEFRGLVQAYNLGMEEEISKFGGDVEKAHKAVIDNLAKDPYSYEDSNTFAKYGNLIENKDCDGSNPHCLNKDVFWKAMKKSYKYQHK